MSTPSLYHPVGIIFSDISTEGSDRSIYTSRHHFLVSRDNFLTSQYNFFVTMIYYLTSQQHFLTIRQNDLNDGILQTLKRQFCYSVLIQWFYVFLICTPMLCTLVLDWFSQKKTHQKYKGKTNKQNKTNKTKANQTNKKMAAI